MCKETKGSSCPTRPKSASIQGVGTGACATLKRPKVCQRTGHCGHGNAHHMVRDEDGDLEVRMGPGPQPPALWQEKREAQPRHALT